MPLFSPIMRARISERDARKVAASVRFKIAPATNPDININPAFPPSVRLRITRRERKRDQEVPRDREGGLLIRFVGDQPAA